MLLDIFVVRFVQLLFCEICKKDKHILNIRLPTIHWNILFWLWVVIWTFRGFTNSALPSPLRAPRYNAQILGERYTEGWLYIGCR